MKKESPRLMTTCSGDKQILRQLLKTKRSAISSERRESAKKALTEKLSPMLSSFSNILSFHSMPEEIDLSALNALLSKQHKLYLPRVENDTLGVYKVEDISQLLSTPWGLYEPNPHLCSKASIDSIQCVLVPGLGFDAHHHRLGYGKGHYDRFLSDAHLIKIGVGFEEQFLASLPYQPHDIPLNQILLF